MRKGPDSYPPEKEFLIAYHIKTLRKRKYPGKGGPQKCADALAVSQSQFYNWENGTRTPRRNNLKKLAGFFGVTLEHFAIIPKDWGDIHREMLKKWHERKGIEYNPDDAQESGVAETREPEAAGEFLPPTDQQAVDGMAQMNELIKLLMKKQIMVETGQLDSKKFIKALEEVRNFTLYQLRD